MAELEPIKYCYFPWFVFQSPLYGKSAPSTETDDDGLDFGLTRRLRSLLRHSLDFKAGAEQRIYGYSLPGKCVEDIWLSFSSPTFAFIRLRLLYFFAFHSCFDLSLKLPLFSVKINERILC